MNGNGENGFPEEKREESETLISAKAGLSPEDDGRTVADMGSVGLPGQRPEDRKNADSLKKIGLTKAERRAMVKGAFAALFPAYFIALGVFCVAFALILLYFSRVS